MDEIHHPITKVILTAGAYVSIAWLDILTTAGKVCAALTAIAIFSEWAWKRVLKPVGVRFGWIDPWKDSEF